MKSKYTSNFDDFDSVSHSMSKNIATLVISGILAYLVVKILYLSVFWLDFDLFIAVIIVWAVLFMIIKVAVKVDKREDYSESIERQTDDIDMSDYTDARHPKYLAKLDDRDDLFGN